MDSVREEVSGIRNENHKTALDLREPTNVGELEQKCGRNTYHDADQQAAEEDEEENSRGLDEADEAVAHVGLLVFLRRLENDNGNGIVQDRLAENDGV